MKRKKILLYLYRFVNNGRKYIRIQVFYYQLILDSKINVYILNRPGQTPISR